MSFKVLLCCLLLCLAVAKTKRHQARRDGGDLVPSTGRGLVDFGLMILCGTGRNPFDYNGYGCYCGFSGHGRPVDDVDRCCQAHDSCYDRVKNGVCSGSIATYTFPYKTTGCIYCKPPSYYWFYGRCRHALCQCDSEAVQCFKSSKYNKRYAHYDKSKC